MCEENWKMTKKIAEREKQILGSLSQNGHFGLFTIDKFFFPEKFYK